VGSVGAMPMPIRPRPSAGVGRPSPIGCHVVPPSVERKSPAAWSVVTVLVLPRALPRSPEDGVDGLRVRRIEREVDRPGVLVAVEDLLERLPAVDRAEDAALRVGAVRMAENRDEEAIGILRIHEDRADLPAVGEPEMRPGLSAVGRFVDPVTHGEVRPLEAFSAPHVEGVRVGRRHRKRSDRARGLSIENGLPGAASVGRLPDAAVVDADVEEIRPARDSGRPDRSDRRGTGRSGATSVRSRGGDRTAERTRASGRGARARPRASRPPRDRGRASCERSSRAPDALIVPAPSASTLRTPQSRRCRTRGIRRRRCRVYCQ
jgi:hypothetical protein